MTTITDLHHQSEALADALREQAIRAGRTADEDDLLNCAIAQQSIADRLKRLLPNDAHELAKAICHESYEKNGSELL